MKLAIHIVRVAHNSYRAWCPALPGCVVHGESRQAAHAKIGGAIEGYLASLDVALPRELNRKFMDERLCASA